MVNNQNIFSNVCLIDSRKKIYEELKHWHLNGSAMEELQELWRGVDVVDMMQPQENMGSTCVLSSCRLSTTYLHMVCFLDKWQRVIKGVLLVAPTHHSRNLRKVVYCVHHRWLCLNHPYRSNKHGFNGNLEWRLGLLVMSSLKHLGNAKLFKSWKPTSSREGDPAVKTRVKQMNVLFELPY